MPSNLGKRFLVLAAVLFCLLSLAACAPTAYKQPVAKFNEATDTAKKVYFQQMDNVSESYAERWRVKRQLDLLAKNDRSVLKMNSAQVNSYEVISEKSLEIRILAFQSLEFYGKTLKALASDDNVDALKEQISGFTGEVDNSLQTLAKVSEVTGQLNFLDKATSLSGPVGAVSQAISQIVKYITDYMREKALKTAIIEVQPSLDRLLALLRDEAKLAASTSRSNYLNDYKVCLKTLQMEGAVSEPTARLLAFNICATSGQKVLKAAPDKEVAEVLDLVIKTHSELYAMAQGGKWDKAVLKIQQFSQRFGLLNEKMSFNAGQ